MKQKSLFTYFSLAEKLIWSLSIIAIVLAYILFDSENILNLLSSTVGITAVIFAAKGNPISHLLTVLFSVFYGIISYKCAYYGEMITYLGLSTPMAILALISWLRHPFHGNRAEVTVSTVSKKEIFWLFPITVLVTVLFYYILKYYNTANLLYSTISIATSFLAAYLSARRSPYYALAYAANDVVLIILWALAAAENIAYISVIICFVAFLVCDIYGYSSWRKMEQDQKTITKTLTLQPPALDGK